MTVLDANVLIAHFDPGHVHHHDAVRLLSERPRDGFVMPAVTIAEVLVGASSDEEAAEMAGDIEQLGIEEALLPGGTASMIALLRRRTGLPIPDCLVMATAGFPGGGGHAIATFDTRLAGKARALGYLVLP